MFVIKFLYQIEYEKELVDGIAILTKGRKIIM